MATVTAVRALRGQSWLKCRCGGNASRCLQGLDEMIIPFSNSLKRLRNSCESQPLTVIAELDGVVGNQFNRKQGD